MCLSITTYIIMMYSVSVAKMSGESNYYKTSQTIPSITRNKIVEGNEKVKVPGHYSLWLFLLGLHKRPNLHYPSHWHQPPQNQKSESCSLCNTTTATEHLMQIETTFGNTERKWQVLHRDLDHSSQSVCNEEKENMKNYYKPMTLYTKFCVVKWNLFICISILYHVTILRHPVLCCLVAWLIFFFICLKEQ